MSEDVDWSGLDPETLVTGPFAEGWAELFDAGWPVLPVGRVGGPLAKNPPMVGRTGHHGTDLHRTGAEDLSAAGWGVCNIAVRMPPGVIGLDVDCYHGGCATLAELEAELGPLPVAPVSTARTDGSGIRFFRVPVDWIGVGGVAGIELIQRHHRFACVAPSIHPKLGEPYRWLGGSVPRVMDLPWLPAAWLTRLDAGDAKPVAHKRVSGADVSGLGGDWLDGLDELDACVQVSTALARRAEAIEDGLGARYDQMVAGVYELVSLHIEGHRGVRQALQDLRNVYGDAVLAERPEWEGEWNRALDGAVAKLEPDSASDDALCECLTDEEIAETLRLWTREAAEPVVHTDPPAAVDDPFNYVPFADPEWWKEPDPVFVLPRVVRAGDAVVIYCGAGRGKSLLAQDAAIGLAVSGVVFGVDVPPEPVLYVDHENAVTELRRRATRFGFSADSDWSRLHYSLLGDWLPLDTLRGGRQLTAEALRVGARLIVLDTVSKTTDGEENSNDTFARLHRFTLRMLKRAGIAVLLLDHTGKDESRGTRGGSAKKQNVDEQFLLSATLGGEYVTLHREKDRTGAYPERVDFRRDPGTGRHEFVGMLPAAAARAMEIESEALFVIDLLDRAGVDADWGRDRIRGWLKAQDPPVRVPNEVLTAAIRIRKGDLSP